jgi:hypothetical protein
MGPRRSKRNESGAPRPLLRAFARAAPRMICCDPGMTTLKLGGHEPRRLSRGADKAPMFRRGSRSLGQARRGRIFRLPPRTRCATLSRTQRRRRMSRYAPTRRGDPRSPWPSDAPLCHVSKGVDDALTPRMQNRLYIGAPTRVGKRIPRGRSGGRRRPSRPVEFSGAAVPRLRRR